MSGDSQQAGTQWGIVGVAFASLFVLGMTDNARGPLFPDILNGLTLTDEQGSWMFATTSAGVGAGSWISRRWVVRWGPLRCLQVALILVAAGLVLQGMAWDLASLVVGSALFGLAFGVLALTQNLMVSEGMAPEHRRQGLSGLHAFYGLASLLAPLGVIALGAGGLGWRGCFVALAILPLLNLAGSLPVRPLTQASRVPPTPRSGLRGLGLVIAIMTGCYVSSELLVSTRLVLLLKREGWSPGNAKLALSAFFALILIGRLSFSLVRFRLTNVAVLALSASLALVLFVAGLVFHPALLILTALPMAPFFPAVVDLLSEAYPGESEEVLGNLFVVISVLLIAAHWGVGWLSDKSSLRVALAVGPGALAVALGLLVWIRLRLARGSPGSGG